MGEREAKMVEGVLRFCRLEVLNWVALAIGTSSALRSHDVRFMLTQPLLII